MVDAHSKLRKAAVLIRSLDAKTAERLLGQLEPEEAAAIRKAADALGEIDSDEQADVLAEFRRVRPIARESPTRGVELALSPQRAPEPAPEKTGGNAAQPFEYLEHADVRKLAPFLAREHAQTIAVVLSHLAPARAAALLDALPEKMQIDVIERMASLGETDPETVAVLESELAGWLESRGSAGSRRKNVVAEMLGAADSPVRERILESLKAHKSAVAEQFAPVRTRRDKSKAPATNHFPRTQSAAVQSQVLAERIARGPERPKTPSPPVAPRFQFDDLVRVDDRMLAAVLQQSEPKVVALALAGSEDELVDRICDQMPRRMARTFRRQLRRLGPTRLSDVEAAQRAVAAVASRVMQARRSSALAGTR